jgi:hypothetical protein
MQYRAAGVWWPHRQHLVFFSTDTNDAWMLEPGDQLAVRGEKFEMSLD